MLTLGKGPHAAAITLKPPADPTATRPPPRSFDVERGDAADPDLRRAQDLLLGAMAANDDGRFFAVAPTLTRDALPPPHLARWLSWLAVALWALLLMAVAGAWLRHPRWPRRWLHVLVGVALVALAVEARQAAPFTPLHANHHAYEDLAVALSLPDAEPSAHRLLAEYGASWLLAQRATVPGFGDDHAAVGRWSTTVGAAAVGVLFLALLASGAPLWGATLATAVVALAPVAVRVGRSESLLVLVQLLVALVLWLAARGRHPLDRLGVLAGLGLLATGHPLGPGYAGGAALLAWAIGPREPGPAPPAVTQALQLPGRVPWSLRARAWLDAHDAGWLLAVLGTVGVGFAVNLAGHGGLVAQRLDATTKTVPLPSNPALFSLWLDPAWAPLSFLALVLAGTVAWLLRLRRSGGPAWPRTLALVLGVAAVAATGLLVTACVTDGLRYQAPLGPALALLAAMAPALATEATAWRWPLRLGVLLAAVLTVVELARTLPGTTALDAQGQAYAALREVLRDRTGDVWLLVPERQRRQVVVLDVPTGKLDAGGPTVKALRVPELEAMCRAGQPRPQPLYVWLDPACRAKDDQPPCAVLERFAGPLMSAGRVRTLPRRHASGMPGEFLEFPAAEVPFRLHEGRCP